MHDNIYVKLWPRKRLFNERYINWVSIFRLILFHLILTRGRVTHDTFFASITIWVGTKLLLVGLCGLGVTCSPRDRRIADSNPAEVDGFF